MKCPKPFLKSFKVSEFAEKSSSSINNRDEINVKRQACLNAVFVLSQKAFRLLGKFKVSVQFLYFQNTQNLLDNQDNFKILIPPQC
jgi:hypothetical protein